MNILFVTEEPKNVWAECTMDEIRVIFGRRGRLVGVGPGGEGFLGFTPNRPRP